MTDGRALIIGVAGQDGSYLAEHLLGLGYEVHGTIRSSSSASLTTYPIGQLSDDDLHRVSVHEADLTDYRSLVDVIRLVRPTEIYNLGAQSRVGLSFGQPLLTGDVTGFGVVRLLDAVREVDPDIRFFQAGSSEMFGATPPPQHEYSPFHPRSPYAVAKVFAHYSTINYREAYGLFACNGILFNHDSPRRPTSFVTRKITWSIPRLLSGELDVLRLGNLHISRDWGHARDYVRAMHLMLQMDEPRDLVIGTGRSVTLEHFLDSAFRHVGEDWHDHVEFDADLMRPADVPDVRADPTRAWGVLGWRAEASVEDLIGEMVDHDVQLAGRRAADRRSG